MDIDKEKQILAKFEIARRLDRAERERAHQRLLKNIEILLGHQFDILLNDEFVEHLSKYLCDLDLRNERPNAMTIADSLGVGCLRQDRSIRERALMVLSVFSGKILEKNDLEFLKKLSSLFAKWLENETWYFSGYDIICVQIQKIGLKLIVGRCWPEADELLRIVGNIQSGALEKSNTIKRVVSKTQENLATLETLTVLSDSYLGAAVDEREHAADLLRSLGRRSVIFLLNKLMHSENKEERFLLMHLLPEVGDFAIPVFEECLRKNPPWYVIRNIIFMICEKANDTAYRLIQPYLSFPDIRVQQQVISYIRTMAGGEMKTRLLDALSKVDPELKVQLVHELGKTEGKEVVDTLLALLENHRSLPASSSDELLIAICLSLKSFPGKKPVKALKTLVAERKKRAIPRDRVLPVAEEAVSILAPKARHTAKSEIGVLNEISYEADAAEENDAKKKIREFIEEINALVGKGGVGKATELMFAEAARAAKNREFKVAELLRDRMMEINPMALAEVLEIGEIIEEQKITTISSHHIETWSSLYETMTTDEFNALYAAMRHESFNPEEIIIESGEIDASLFFINSGMVRLSCLCGNKEVFLKRLLPGEIVGVGQFFSASVWTVTLTAQNVSQMHVLDRERFNTLRERFPDLEPRLMDFCSQYDIVPSLLRMTGSDRREYARYPASLMIESALLDPYGKKEQQTIQGQLMDISMGGVAFSIPLPRKEDARLLLGRQIVSVIHLKTGGEKLKCFGMVVGVRLPQIGDEHDCSVHVKLYSLMQQSEVLKINRLMG